MFAILLIIWQLKVFVEEITLFMSIYWPSSCIRTLYFGKQDVTDSVVYKLTDALILSLISISVLGAKRDTGSVLSLRPWTSHLPGSSKSQPDHLSTGNGTALPSTSHIQEEHPSSLDAAPLWSKCILYTGDPHHNPWDFIHLMHGKPHLSEWGKNVQVSRLQRSSMAKKWWLLYGIPYWTAMTGM